MAQPHRDGKINPSQAILALFHVAACSCFVCFCLFLLLFVFACHPERSEGSRSFIPTELLKPFGQPSLLSWPLPLSSAKRRTTPYCVAVSFHLFKPATPAKASQILSTQKVPQQAENKQHPRCRSVSLHQLHWIQNQRKARSKAATFPLNP